MPTPQRPARKMHRRAPSKPAGPSESVLPSFPELLALLAPFAGAAIGWWFGSRLGTIWHGVVGGVVGTGLGAWIARRGAPDILP